MPDTLEERRARYERIVAMRANGMTLTAIGAEFDPPLKKQRVLQILSHEPQRNGRPHAHHRRATLRSRLKFWEARRAMREDEGLDTAYADERIKIIADQIAALESD